MTRLAGFPMYDFPEIRSATDRFWSVLYEALAERGVKDMPHMLTRPHDLPAFWRDPALLLGQTCGYPLMLGLCGQARYVATPCYATSRSHGAQHKSVIIAHHRSRIKTLADAQGSICAINMHDSNTGMNLLRLEVAKLNARAPFFSRVFETLAHRNSMFAVQSGDADVAAIDCVSYALLEKIEPTLVDDLKVIAETEETPALPFITSPETDDDTLSALRDALQSVIAAPLHRVTMQTLMLDGIDVLSPTAYMRVREIEDQAIALGYPMLN